MKILGLDTSGNASSVALFDASAGRVVATEHVAIERGHAEVIFAQIDRVMARAGLTLKSIDRFAVTTGPGTFTGVRIGLSAARGFALAAGRPLIGLNSLEVTAASVAPSDAVTVAAFDARRGELYVQAFRSGTALMPPFASSIEATVEALLALGSAASSFALIGSGAAVLAEALGRAEVPTMIVSAETGPDAAVLARLAAALPVPLSPPQPLYLRAPDAKLPAATAGNFER